MGLDMYLDGVKYISPSKTNNIQKRRIIKTLEIYWRKANAIHNWFVENIQNGEDDCRNYEVHIEDLKLLKENCKQVLQNRELAHSILPTVSGFFFGETNYDEWYFDELERTYNEISRLIKKNKYDWYEYSSSW